MSEKILVPVLGESITEATVAKWLKNTGDTVEVDEPIVELETDKVNLEVPSPVKGVLTEINSKDGSVVEVGALLGTVSESGTAETAKKEDIKIEEPAQKEDNVIKLDPSKKEPKIFEEKTEKNDQEEPLVLTDEVIEEEALKTKTEQSEPKTNRENQTLSPAVRKIVVENKIDINSVKGSGKDGRVLKGDLISLMGTNPQPSERKVKYGQEERIKMTRLRQTIAKRLKQAQENAALLTTFNEVDMTNIMEMRKENQQDFQSRYGIKLGFMSFFVKACVVALKNFPAVNAEIDGDEIIYKNYYNINNKKDGIDSPNVPNNGKRQYKWDATNKHLSVWDYDDTSSTWSEQGKIGISPEKYKYAIPVLSGEFRSGTCDISSTTPYFLRDIPGSVSVNQWYYNPHHLNYEDMAVDATYNIPTV